MTGHLVSTALAAVLLSLSSIAISAPSAAHGHYIFAWAGDPEGKAEDFIAVINGDPDSPDYAHLVASGASGVKTQQIHHTEYWMPEGGFLFANDHAAGRTVVMDLRDPLHPRVNASFGDLGGYSHPHSFLRLPNGHVLAAFQVEGHMDHGASSTLTMPMQEIDSGRAVHGGIVEIDDGGKMIRAASTADPARPGDLLMAYGVLPLPDIDRVLVTNSSMRDEDKTGHTYQVFRLSDLTRLSTNDLDAPAGSYGEINPEEARRGPDGSVFIQTTGCGIERITGIAADNPHAKLVYQFAGSLCGVPNIVSHYLIQTVRLGHMVVVIDIANPEHPIEVSRVVIGAMSPHWTSYDAKTHRIAVTGYGENRLFMLKFDPETGAIAIDGAFRDRAGRPGFDLTNRAWPHGWTGTAQPHGVVFSR